MLRASRLCSCLLTTWFALAAVASAQTAIFWASDPVRPGEAVVVVGNGLGSEARVTVARLADDPAGSLPAAEPGALKKGVSVATIQPQDGSVKFVLPPEFKPGVFALEITGREGAARQLLNRPVVWWAQGDAGSDASPGGWIRVFGKNLDNSGKLPVTALLQGPKSARLTATGDNFALEAKLPPDLPEGRYTLSVHNGCGGAAGWSEGRAFTVRRPAAWPDKVYDVTTFGADPDGQSDSSPAAEAALAAIEKAGGGVLYFPRGRYQLTRTLTVPRLVTIRGAGRELVSLFWPDVQDPLPAQIRGTNSFRLEDLTLYCSNYSRFLVADDLQPQAGNVRLRRLVVRANRYRGHMEAAEVDRRLRAGGGNQTPLLTLGGANVEITDCDLYSSGMVFWLNRLRGALIARNALSNGRSGWYSLSGSDGVVFEHNQIVGGDLSATGGGLNCLDGSTYSQHVYYAHNTLRNMFGWDREAMTSDAGGGAYFGKVASAHDNVVTLAGDPTLADRDWAGAGFYLLDGKGSGQYRRVVAAKGREVTVDRPWQVPPDGTSVATCCNYQGRCLFIDNDFTDAGIALQFYGNALEHISAGNRSARTAGYHNFGMIYAGGIQPNWYLQWLDNRITEGNVYRGDHDNWRASGEAHIGVYAFPPQADWNVPLTLGTIVRRNVLENNAHIMLGCEWSGGGFERKGRYVRDVLVEDNDIRNADLGIFAYATAQGVVLRNNSFANVRAPLGGPGLPQAYMTSADRAAALRVSLDTLLASLDLHQDVTRFPEVMASLASLAKLPDGSPEATRLEGVAMKAVLARIAQLRPQGLPLNALDGVFGLKVWVPYACSAYPTLQSGAGGAANLDVELTPASVPGGSLPVSAEVELPAGWQGGKSQPGELTAQGTLKLSLPLTIPAGEWASHSFPLTLNLLLGDQTLRLHTTVSAGSGFVHGWMLLGPFPNQSATALDLKLLPPDDGLDLDAQCDGLKGKIAWQPWEDGDWLRFNALYPGEVPVGAYAVACINTPRALPVEVRVGGAASFALTLNGDPLWRVDRPAPAGPGNDGLPVQLREGDNVFVFRLASKPVDWTFVCDLEPAPGGPPLTGVKVISPKEFRGRPCFAPPPKRAAPETGEVRHPAGVSWRLVHADNFDRPNLGARWRVGSGKWEIKDGLLYARDVAFLAYAEKLPAPVRIEYDTRVPGQVGGDLSACWLSDPAQYTSGVLIGFGSNGNTLNKVVLNGEQVASAPAPLVVPGRWHHVIAQILADGRVQLIVDDQLSLDYRGQPAGEARYPGLWAWNSDGVFAKVRIYAGGP